jgi:translocator protein
MNTTASPLIPAASTRSMIFLLIAVVIVTATSWMGSVITASSLAGWYSGLNKPWFNPPNWVFPVAWTTLFLLMAFSFWRILRQVDGGPSRNTAIFAFMVQVLFNLSWSFAFFGARSPFAGLCVAVGLLASVAAMVMTFRRIDRLAGNTQLPYLAWVSFALVLNFTIWRIN